MLLSKVIILLLVLVWGCTECLVLEAPASIVSPNLYHLSPCFLGSPLYSPLRRSPEDNNTVIRWIHKARCQFSYISSSPCHWCIVWNFLDVFDVLSVISYQSGVFSDPRLVFFFLSWNLLLFLLISHKPSCAVPTFPRYLKSCLCDSLTSFAHSHLTDFNFCFEDAAHPLLDSACSCMCWGVA